MGTSSERVHILVPAGLRRRFEWFGKLAKRVTEQALRKEREVRSKPRIRSARANARYLTRRSRAISKMLERSDADRAKLLLMWAQHHISNIEGVAIRPAVTLGLDEQAIVQSLDPETKAAVISMQPVLDLDKLLFLARNDSALQELIERHVSAKVILSVTPPKK